MGGKEGQKATSDKKRFTPKENNEGTPVKDGGVKTKQLTGRMKREKGGGGRRKKRPGGPKRRGRVTQTTRNQQTERKRAGRS